MAKKNLSKLVKKVITDKRGHKQSVWVKPSGSKDAKKNPTLAEVNPELHDKIKRGEKGKGHAVKLSRQEVRQVLMYGKIGLMSAGRNPSDPRDMKLTDAQIEARGKQLKKDLTDMGYTFVDAHGRYEGLDEDSVMIMANDIDKKNLTTLGTKYHQDSVIYSDGNHNEYIYTTGSDKGKRYRGHGWDVKKEEVDDYFTEITTPKGKLKFLLDFNFSDLRKGIKLIIQKGKK